MLKRWIYLPPSSPISADRWTIVEKGSRAHKEALEGKDTSPTVEGGIVGSSEWLWLKGEHARLITAAPELLEACKILRKMMDDGELIRDISGDADSDYHMKMIRFVEKIKKLVVAITRAEGGPQ